MAAAASRSVSSLVRSQTRTEFVTAGVADATRDAVSFKVASVRPNSTTWAAPAAAKANEASWPIPDPFRVIVVSA